MAYELNEKQGSLFRNEKTNERQPDYRGNAKIDGHDYSISAWVKKSQNGKQYLSLSFGEPYNKQASAPAPAPAQAPRTPLYEEARKVDMSSDPFEPRPDDLPF